MPTITPAYNTDAGSTFGSTYNGNTFASGTVGINGTNHESMCFLFNSVLLPQGATITSAVMSILIDVADEDGNPSLITFKAALSAADTVAGLPTTFTAFNTAARTTAHTTQAGPTSTPMSLDVTTAVQEVVNRPGWASGNNFLIYLDYASGSGTNDFIAGTSGSTFTIIYTTGGGGATVVPPQIIVPNFAQQRASSW